MKDDLIFLKIKDDLKNIMQPKTVKSKNIIILENGRRPKIFFGKGRLTQLFKNGR
jgi:hypothetical protein